MPREPRSKIMALFSLAGDVTVRIHRALEGIVVKPGPVCELRGSCVGKRRAAKGGGDSPPVGVVGLSGHGMHSIFEEALTTTFSALPTPK